MTVRERIAALLPRIELRRWPWRIDVRPGQTHDQLITVTEYVKDRDTGEPIRLGGMLYDAPPPDSASDAELVLWVRDQLRKHVLHELDEAFLVDGVRVCDPHGGDLYIEIEDEKMSKEQERLQRLADAAGEADEGESHVAASRPLGLAPGQARKFVTDHPSIPTGGHHVDVEADEAGQVPGCEGLAEAPRVQERE